jgi:uncharacterized protein YhfF
MPTTDHADFWQAYLATLPADHPHHHVAYDAWGFGDSPELADELGQIVVAGTKRATASLVQAYAADGDPIPPVGDLSIILDGAGSPLCIIETTEVTIGPLNGVDAQFAWDEGEGDRSRAYWLEAHERFFRRECATYGFAFHMEIPVVFERFRVVYQPE